MAGALLVGCATAPQPLSESAFAEALGEHEKQVEVLLGEKKDEQALELLDKLARDNPARKEPWVRQARIHFDAEDYGNAIVAAEEALKRDGADKTAKSVRAVSGLRVATQSLADLRDDIELKGSARADAMSLATMLRETLGEDVLVPPVEREKPAPKPRRRVRRAAAAPAPVAAPVAAPAVKAPAAPSVNGDPFSVLK